MNLEKCEELGIEVQKALALLNGNEALYEKLLLKVPDLLEAEDLEKLMLEKEYEKAFSVAHMRKGTMGNLSIRPLYELYGKMVAHMREKKPEEALSCYQKGKEAQKSIIQFIKQGLMGFFIGLFTIGLLYIPVQAKDASQGAGEVLVEESGEKVVRVGYLANLHPYCYQNEADGSPGGIFVTIFEQFEEGPSGGDMQFAFYAYEDGELLRDALERGEVDVIFPAYENKWSTQMRDSNYLKTESFLDMTLESAYRKADSKDRFQKIGIGKGSLIQKDYVIEHFPQAEIKEYNSVLEGLRGVERGEVDSTILTSAMCNTYLKKTSGIARVTLENKPRISLACNKKDVQLRDTLNKKIEKLDYAKVMHSLVNETIKAETYGADEFIEEFGLYFFLAIVFIVFVMLVLTHEMHRQKQYKAVAEKAREEAEKAREEAEKAKIEADKARVEAERANRAKSTFLSNMSHDVRTPMNAIVGYTQLAKEHVEDVAAVRSYLDKISMANKSLLNLIDEILEISHIESGRISVKKSPVRMPDALDALIMMVQDSAWRKNITLEVVMHVTHNWIVADKAHMDRVMLNILGNAVKYTPDGGKVVYTITEHASEKEGYGMYEFVIEDNGFGISEDFQKHIFESFTRERTTQTENIQGTGLGMTIVKNMVQTIGGQVSLESKLGEGTKVTVLMEYEICDEESMKTKSRLEVKEKVGDIDRKLQVLLVEDNDINMEIAQTVLEDMGLEVQTAKNGKEAIELLEKSEPGEVDVILMDIQMPIIDGYEAAKRIRKMEEAWKANIPIIAMTANAFPEDMERAIEAGMNAHIAKPFQKEILFEKLQYVLE